MTRRWGRKGQGCPRKWPGDEADVEDEVPGGEADVEVG